MGGGGKVLVIGPAWVGDMVMSQALYRQLVESGAAETVDVLAPDFSAPLLARMPEVRRVIPMPLGHGEFGFLERRRLGRALRREGYGQAIVLPNSWKSALVPAFARIPRRTGWRGEMRHGLLNDLRYLDKGALPLMVQRFVALGLDANQPLPAPLPWPRLAVSPDAAAAVEHFGIDTSRPLLALCPGAEFGPAKCWPPDYFAALAQHYLGQGWQVALHGSEGDVACCGAIEAQLSERSHALNLAGRTSLGEAVDLLSLSTAVVSNDSGLMHIAAAVQRPTLAIFGATSPDFTPPLSPRAAIVRTDLDCSPCFQRECPLGHHRCMRDIDVDTVRTRLEALLAAAGAPAA